MHRLLLARVASLANTLAYTVHKKSGRFVRCERLPSFELLSLWGRKPLVPSAAALLAFSAVPFVSPAVPFVFPAVPFVSPAVAQSELDSEAQPPQQPASFGTRRPFFQISSPDVEEAVYELHGTKDDCASKGWLDAAFIMFHPSDLSTFSQPAASAFDTTSACCVAGCHNRVEVGAPVTSDGGRLWIIPTCDVHSSAGALDRLGADSRLKRNTVYLSLSLPEGVRIEARGDKLWYNKADSPEEV